jgi:hypothetical protein
MDCCPAPASRSSLFTRLFNLIYTDEIAGQKGSQAARFGLRPFADLHLGAPESESAYEGFGPSSLG